ncbi:MAG: ROK family protein, partial [Bacteroidota bacterium]
MYKIGIDLGGTKIEGVVLDSQGGIIERERVSTGKEQGYDHVVKVVSGLYLALRKRIGNQEHQLGIGTPGHTDRQGLIRNSSLLCLNDKALIGDIERLTGIRPETENDANCFAVAEALLGAGKGKDVVFGVIMGTGCGGGVVINNKLIRGHQYLGGEIGHAVLHPGGRNCFCGNKGCVERYISGSGIEEQYKDKTGTRKSLRVIVDEYREGNPDAEEIMNNFFEDFGVAMSTLINILDPDLIVLGGGVSNIDELYTIGIEKVRKNVFMKDPEIRIARNMYGDSAGVIGAALLHD